MKSIICAGLLYSSANGTSLRDSVEQTINTNPDIIAKHFKQKSFKLNIAEQQGDYYPTIDFATYYETSSTTHDKDTELESYDVSKNGWNANIKIEQVLYDGGQTPNEVEMYRHRYENIKYTNQEDIEKIILDIVNVYTEIVSYQEKIALDNYKIKIHNQHLKLAKEKEELSGEILDRILVNSKIKSAIDSYLLQEVSQQKALSSYKKLAGDELSGNICRPIIDETSIPATLDSAIEIALRRNNEIIAQEEIIREQTARHEVENAKFKPNLKLQLQGDLDDDLRSAENGRQDIYRIRLQTEWNIYEGGKDSISSEKERIAILEERKNLDTISNQVIDNIKGSYNTYFKLKKRIENLKAFVVDNQDIVDIYNSQLEDGTRTFIDVLGAETELFRTKSLLIDQEFELYNEYYNILRSLNMLSDTILMESNQSCQQYVFVEPAKRAKPAEKTEAELSKELGLN